MVFKGFKLGMILQLAIGPVCLFIFQTAVNSGLFKALLGVLGVTLVDGLFILSAIWGLGKLLEKKSALKSKLGYLGGSVLILFGVSTLLSIFGIALIPSLSLTTTNSSNIILKTMLMTLSNPLTIVFWAGIFSTSIEKEDFEGHEIYQFGFGAISATFIFLSFVAFLGDTLSIWVADGILDLLNGCVGLFLIAFGVKSLIKNYRA